MTTQIKWVASSTHDFPIQLRLPFKASKRIQEGAFKWLEQWASKVIQWGQDSRCCYQCFESFELHQPFSAVECSKTKTDLENKLGCSSHLNSNLNLTSQVFSAAHKKQIFLFELNIMINVQALSQNKCSGIEKKSISFTKVLTLNSALRGSEIHFF